MEQESKVNDAQERSHNEWVLTNMRERRRMIVEMLTQLHESIYLDSNSSQRSRRVCSGNSRL